MTNQTERYLFRGMRIDTKEFVEGDLIFNQVIVPHNSPSGSMGNNNDGSISVGVNVFDVIPETIGQFTGLLDKNGVNIFEGDIVQSTVQKGLIQFDKGLFGINWDFEDEDGFESMKGAWGNETNLRKMYDGYNLKCEVIGSIHDHLKTESK